MNKILTSQGQNWAHSHNEPHSQMIIFFCAATHFPLVRRHASLKTGQKKFLNLYLFMLNNVFPKIN